MSGLARGRRFGTLAADTGYANLQVPWWTPKQNNPATHMRPSHVRPLLPLLLAGLLAVGCDDFATAPDRRPAAIRVSPDTVLLSAGESVALEVQVLDEDGVPYDPLPAWAPPLFTSEDPDVTTIDATGLATALQAGEIEALVEIGGLQSSALLRANPVRLRLDLPFNYITQTTQRQSGTVPLIADRQGLLRVYVRGDDINWFQPKVRATFFDGDEAVHSVLMSFDAAGVPEAVDEGNLAVSYDATVPAEIVRPGLRLALEIDPEGVVPVADGSVLRLPAAGALELNVREVPPFRWMLVPVTQSINGRQSLFTPVFGRQMSELAEEIFPFQDFQVDVRVPYVTDQDLRLEGGWFNLIEDIRVLRLADEQPHYYYGGFQRPPGTGIAGLGYVGLPVAIGMDNRDDVIAHELGHNLGLPHAPCGGPAGVDPNYPYAQGKIGVYGWDGRHRRLHDPADRYDLMSYCDPIWISDYNYENVIAYRDSSEFDAAFVDGATPGGRAVGPGSSEAAARARTGREPVLVLRGGVLDGALRLGPALELEARPVVPTEGAYRLEGLDAGGGVVFSVPVEPRKLDHLGGSQFLVALPSVMARPERLATLRLSGPEGTVERRAGPPREPAVTLEAAVAGQGTPGIAMAIARFDPEAFPLAVVRDRATGLIRAMSRSGRVAVPSADPAELDIVLSDGIRSVPARVVRK